MSDVHHLVISALGPDRVGLVADLTAFLGERRANLEDSRMAMLGGEFGMMALVSGTEAAIARVERELTDVLGPKTGASFVTRRTKSPEEHRKGDTFPVLVTAESFDREGITLAITSALETLRVSIVALETTQWSAPFTGAPLFRLEVRADVPRGTTIANVRAAMEAVAVHEHLDVGVKSLAAQRG
ncbi:amino acid-binding protein [soil metagenome]